MNIMIPLAEKTKSVSARAKMEKQRRKAETGYQ